MPRRLGGERLAPERPNGIERNHRTASSGTTERFQRNEQERARFYEVGLEMVDHTAEGPLRFRVFTERNSVVYEVRFRGNEVAYVPVQGEDAKIVLCRQERSLAGWFEKEPPVFLFEDGALLVYNQYAEPPHRYRVPFDRRRIEAWTWEGTDLKKESQTQAKRPDSIQFRLIQELLSNRDISYDLVFDDDSSNEAADVVAIKIAGEHLIVHLFHCKYSSQAEAGGRVNDLYAVCGQAQRSVHWRGHIQALIDHLQHRENLRLRKGGVSRFERGDLTTLRDIARAARYLRPEFKIFVVQPGLSKSESENAQFELLGATELYLRETYEIPLGVIASA